MHIVVHVYSTSKWINSTISLTTTLSANTDVTISSPLTNQVLTYNGTKWTNQSMQSMTLEQNSDVNVTSISDKNILRYNALTGKWLNVADLTTDEANINQLLVSTGILINTTSTTQNTVLLSGYTDGTTSNILHGNNTTASNLTPISVVLYPADNIQISGYKVNDRIWVTKHN